MKKIELNVNKDTLKEIGKGAGKIGKAIVIEGTKAVVLKGAAAVITQSFDEGFGKVKELKLDDYLKGGKKNNEPKKSLFNKKDETEESVEKPVGVMDAEYWESDTKSDNSDDAK